MNTITDSDVDKERIALILDMHKSRPDLLLDTLNGYVQLCRVGERVWASNLAQIKSDEHRAEADRNYVTVREYTASADSLAELSMLILKGRNNVEEK